MGEGVCQGSGIFYSQFTTTLKPKARLLGLVEIQSRTTLSLGFSIGHLFEREFQSRKSAVIAVGSQTFCVFLKTGFPGAETQHHYAKCFVLSH